MAVRKIGIKMHYDNFKELHKNYINCNDGDIDRDKMDDDTHKAFIEDCFDTYESIGFSKTYGGPYTEYENHKGMKFKVDRRCTVEDDIDLIFLPMWKITFEDGFQINAEPEKYVVHKKLEHIAFPCKICYNNLARRIPFRVNRGSPSGDFL